MLYYATDANFNVTALVEASDGSVGERVVYDPCGKPTFYDGSWQNPSATSACANAVLYTGHRLDDETGLYQPPRRYYHATLGRWLSRDPAGYQDGMNLYEYCRSGPVGATDAMGIQAEAVPHEAVSLDAQIAYLQRQKEQWHQEYELAREQGNAEAAENFQYMIVHCGRLQLELKERRAGMEVGAFEAARRNYLRAGGSEEGYLIDTIVRYWLSVAGIDANWETYLALEKMKVDKPLAAFLGWASGLAKLHGLEAAVETVTGKNVAALRQNIIYDRKQPTQLGYVDRGFRGLEAVFRLWIYFKTVKPRPMQETGKGWTAREEALNARANITDELSNLRAGRSPGVKVVGSEAELDALFSRLSAEGKPATPSTYPGRMVELPDGTLIGLRDISASGGPTIDVFPTGARPIKVHVER